MKYLKGALLVLWALCVLMIFWFMHEHGIRLRELPALIKRETLEAGIWGPLVIIGLYVASTILLFSKGAIDVASGAIYGPLWGSLVVLIGLNLAGFLTFFLSRYFGRHFVHTHEKGWLKKYDDLLHEEGFMTVLFMRLLFFPFDVVSVGCGLSRMSFRQFFLGTLFGSIPSTVTYVMLGGAFTSPRTWVYFSFLFVCSAGAAFGLRRLPWIRKKLYKEVPSVME